MNEKYASLRRSANATGFSLAAFFAATAVFSAVAVEISVGSQLPDAAILYSLSLAAYAVPALLMRFFGGARAVDSEALARPKRADALQSAALYFAAVPIAIALNSLTCALSGLGWLPAAEALPSSGAQLAIRLVYAIIAVPALETLVFHQLLLEPIKSCDEASAALFSAVCFALCHEAREMPSAFVMGLALAWIHIKTGSALQCFALHALHNALSAAYALFSAGGRGVSAFMAALGALCVFGATFTVRAIVKYKREGGRLPRANPECARALFCAGGFICYAALALFIAFVLPVIVVIYMAIPTT